MLQIKHFQFNPFQENTYVLYNDNTNEAAVIDAGCLELMEKKALEQFIKEHDLVLKQVLNTHLHLDHQFGNKFLFDTFGIAPVAHPADEFMIEKMPSQAAAFGLQVAEKGQPLCEYLEDNQQIKIVGFDFRVIATPGHSPGGVCFYCEAQNLLIAGDTLFRCSIGRTDLPQGNHETLIRSIKERLLILPDDTVVLCGHGPSTTIGDEKLYNGFLK